MIDGIIDDTKLIMTYLPSYLNLEYHLCDHAKVHHNTTIKFSNILSGYSLGGHTVIRFANKYPDLVDIINPVVGCNDLSSLLINRLFNSELDSPNFDKRWFYFDYNELMLTDDQKKYVLRRRSIIISVKKIVKYSTIFHFLRLRCSQVLVKRIL